MYDNFIYMYRCMYIQLCIHNTLRVEFPGSLPACWGMSPLGHKILMG